MPDYFMIYIATRHPSRIADLGTLYRLMLVAKLKANLKSWGF